MKKLILLLALLPTLAFGQLTHETSPSPVEASGDFGGTFAAVPTTASFDPPDTALLVGKISATEFFTNQVQSVSCSGGSLTWNVIDQWGANFNGTASDAGAGYAAMVYALAPSSGSMTVACTVTWESEHGFTARLDLEVWTGHDTGDPIGATNHAGPSSDTGSGISPTLIATTEAIGRVLYAATDQQGNSGCVSAPSSTDTHTSAFMTDATGCALSAYKASDHSASASVAGNMNANGAGATAGIWNWVAAEVKQGGAAASREQEGFRWGMDDGSESAHGWEAAQDTNISIVDSQSRLLRVLVDATDDPASTAYSIRYQKDGSGGYVAVPVGSTTETTPVIEVGDITESGNNTASASWAINHPAASTGDLLIWNVSWDDSTDTTALTAPAGQNAETISTIVGPVASSATSVRGKVFYTVATGSWTASTLTFTPSATEQWTAVVIRVPAGEFDPTTPIGASNSLASGSTSNPSTPTLSAGSSDGNGKLVTFISSDTDDADGTMTGWTGLASTDRGAIAGDLLVRDTAVTDSESVSSSSGLTYPTARDWVSFVYVVRAPSVNNEVYITTSANITAGGEATTARLTAPGAKSTSDFDTGRRWDDENGTDSTDITADNYSEFEWLIALSSAPADSAFFDFRVYAGGSALDTYTVTPRWTVASAGGGGTQPARTMHMFRLRR